MIFKKKEIKLNLRLSIRNKFRLTVLDLDSIPMVFSRVYL